MRFSSSYRAISVSLFLFVALFSTYPAHAATKKTPQATELQAGTPVADATVNLYCNFRTGRKIISTSGTGVFIDPKGIILTNAHVAQDFLIKDIKKKLTGSCMVRTGSPAKATYTASVLYFPTDWIQDNADQLKEKKPRGTGEDDFALLYVTGATRTLLPSTFPAIPLETIRVPGEAEAITIAGYPAEKLSFRQIQTKLKELTASSTITSIRSFDANQGPADLLMLATSPLSSHGVSGGPVLDSSQRVLGIVTGKSSSETAPTLRAISAPYINRVITRETGASLATLLAGNLSLRAASTSASISEETITLITDGLLKAR